jgi:hypothetical protein
MQAKAEPNNYTAAGIGRTEKETILSWSRPPDKKILILHTDRACYTIGY